MHGAMQPFIWRAWQSALVKAHAEGAQAERRTGGRTRIVVDRTGFGEVLGGGGGFIVRDSCVGTGFKDTMVFVMEQVFFVVMGYKPLRE